MKSIDYIADIGWQKYMGDGCYTFGYINSYKEAGDILVEEKVPDLLIYPIMFCYRQYLELLLKNIYMKNNTEDYKDYVNNVSHNIIKSWEYVKPILLNQIKDKELSFIEEVICFFDKLDSSSFTFRYEYDKRMNRNIDDKRIDTKKVKSCIKKIDKILRYTYDSE